MSLLNMLLECGELSNSLWCEPKTECIYAVGAHSLVSLEIKTSLCALRLYCSVKQGVVTGKDWEICVITVLVISSK